MPEETDIPKAVQEKPTTIGSASEPNSKPGKSDNIELRSDEVREILGRPPRWIIRWGICVIFGVVLALLIGSVFFRYPDVITSEVTLTTEHPAVWVVARSTGKLQQLLVSDKQMVNENDLLAVIENPAVYNDVKALRTEMETIKPFFADYDASKLILSQKDYHLGELQDSYAQFYTAMQDYLHFEKQQVHQKKLAALIQQLNSYEVYRATMQNQEKLQRDNLTLVQKQFERDTKLFESKVLSLTDYEDAEKVLLSSKQALEQAKSSLSTTEITIEQLKQSKMELELDYAEQLKTLKNTVKASYESLTARIATWEQQYLLKAAASGTVTFAKIWSENQQVSAGDKVFGIVAEKQGKIIGKVQLPVTGAGKVKEGQRVNIKLDGYPYMEYGMLPATVASISLVPEEKLYTVQLSVPDDLKTFYGTKIEFTGELTGTAEIATDEMSLFQRLLNPLKYFFKRNT